MESLNKSVGLLPQWVQPKTFQNRYELRSGEQVFASLEFPKAFGTLATGAAADGRWTFKRVGFFNVHVTVRREGEENDLGDFRPRWTGTEGIFQMAGGAAYTWKVANFWATQFVIQNASGQPLILFKPGVEDAAISDWFKTQSRVEIQPEVYGLKELSLLVLLGWYLMILKNQDDSSAVAATTAAT